MFDNLVGRVALGWARHFLTTASGGLVAHGWLTGDQQQQLVGALMTVAALGLSAYDKAKSTSKEPNA